MKPKGLQINRHPSQSEIRCFECGQTWASATPAFQHVREKRHMVSVRIERVTTYAPEATQ